MNAGACEKQVNIWPTAGKSLRSNFRPVAEERNSEKQQMQRQEGIPAQTHV